MDSLKGAVLVSLPMETKVMEAAIGGLGPWELGIILVIVLVIFGAGKLPTIGAAIGKAVKNLKGELKGRDDEKGPHEGS